MKTNRYLYGAVSSAMCLFLMAGCGDNAKKLQAENDGLRAEIAELKTRAEAESQSGNARATELKRAQSDAQDLVRLRGEVTQLRTAAKDIEKLRAENQQLRAENQQLRGATAATPATTTPAPAPVPGSFPRESWSHAGYASPEAALVSAIYSMQQGNPKQYFESLTPEEQARMSKTWENKTEAEIAAKHQGDTAAITGMKVLNTQEAPGGQVVMSVYIEGVDRTEKVSMKRVGNDWKFNGFIREPKQ
jgi:hypothetical protein